MYTYTIDSIMGFVFFLCTIIFTFIDPQIAQAFAILFVGSAIHINKH